MKLLELRANAKLLARNLEDERSALTACPLGQPLHLTEVYDALYLSRMAALAEGLAGFDIPGLELLRPPLDPARAASQLKNWIDVLRAIVVILTPN